MIVRSIIPAAGQGKRMSSDVPKQFLKLAGQPILYHTLDAFERSGLVESISLVVPPKETDAMKAKWPNWFPRVTNVVAGGKERQDSVYNGLCSLDKDTEIVIVHDGVRPFLTSSMISEVVNAAAQHGAAILALPLSDTLKRGDSEGFVQKTLNRDDLWRVQTPQAFRYNLLCEAMKKARVDNFYGTDEGMLIERLGKSIKLIPGSERNIKITRHEDLRLAELLAASTDSLK